MASKITNLDGSSQGRCDIKTWSGDCRQNGYQSDGEKYLCTSCGTLAHLDHEVGHDSFPYVSGDYDRLH